MYVDQPETDIDHEQKSKSQKRLKHAVRHLITMKTTRMLEIIGYRTSEKDAKRLDYAINTFGSMEKVIKPSQSLVE